MLLYSTILLIKDTLTIDDFIQLVIQWNQSSHRLDNIIPDLDWNGERNIRFEADSKWLEIQEYQNKNIIAIRYEKQDDNGFIWDTDFIMNFETMKMSIQLIREYTEDAPVTPEESPRFSTPYFIDMLIDGGYLEDDGQLPVLHQSIEISENNLSLLTEVINGQVHYQLPVVFVSKTRLNRNPFDVHLLNKKLKGVAHILVQENKQTNHEIHSTCRKKHESLGETGIYFPNGKHKSFPYKALVRNDKKLLDRITKAVFQYLNAPRKQNLSTWHEVNHALLADKYVSQKEEAEQVKNRTRLDIEKYITEFDEDNARLRKQVAELTSANATLQLENQGLRAKLNGAGKVPVLFLGEEDEFYQNEIKEMILDAVADKLKNLSQNSRRRDVLNDILKSNNYQHVGDKREQIVKVLFNDYKNLSGSMRQQLLDLGLEVIEDGRHYRLVYYGDERYKTTIARSGSDWREGKNVASVILKTMM